MFETKNDHVKSIQSLVMAHAAVFGPSLVRQVVSSVPGLTINEDCLVTIEEGAKPKACLDRLSDELSRLSPETYAIMLGRLKTGKV